MKPGAIGAMVLLLAGDAYAQEPIVLSLDDAVKIALEREPTLRAVRAELDAARGMRRQAGLRPNPSVMFDRREEPGGTDNQTMVQVSLPLDLFRRSARIGAAERVIDVADRSAADRERQIVNDVKMKYGAAAAALRDRGVAAEVASAGRHELELLRKRVDEGASPPLERDLIDVEVRRLEAARLVADGRAAAALFALTRTLGMPASTPVGLRDTLETLTAVEPPAEPGPATARPDVLEAEARVRLADARIAEAEAEGRFDVSVIGSFMRMDAGFPQRAFGATGDLERVRGVFKYVSVGAMVMVPLTNRNQGSVDAARAERAAAAARFEAVQLANDEERASALVLATHTRQAVAMMRESARLARQNLDVVRQTYELGRGTLGDVLIEQRRYLEIEHEYTTALREAFEAHASLEFAQGELR